MRGYVDIVLVFMYIVADEMNYMLVVAQLVRWFDGDQKVMHSVPNNPQGLIN